MPSGGYMPVEYLLRAVSSTQYFIGIWTALTAPGAQLRVTLAACPVPSGPALKYSTRPPVLGCSVNQNGQNVSKCQSWAHYSVVVNVWKFLSKGNLFFFSLYLSPSYVTYTVVFVSGVQLSDSHIHMSPGARHHSALLCPHPPISPSCAPSPPVAKSLFSYC